MNYSVRTIPAAQLDDNHTYQITTCSDTEDLGSSIRGIGLIHPPILIETTRGFTIISGFRRISACAALGRGAFPARVLPADTDALTCIRLAIADNALQRSLNLVEISRSLNLLARAIPDPDDLLEAASELALADNFGLIQKILKLDKLSRPIQEGILAGVISLPMALQLAERDAAVASILVNVFRKLKLGLNRQRELVTLLTEIALREDKSVLQVIGSADVKEILEFENEDAGLKSGLLRQYLRRRRYPHITTKTEAFDNLRKNMGLGSAVRLTPPRDFEGTAYTATLTFQSLDELEDRKNRLDRIIHNREFNKFLEG